VFEGVAEKCRAVKDGDNEFKGYVTISYENVHVYNKEKDHYGCKSLNPLAGQAFARN
jgi:hypothetical protein